MTDTTEAAIGAQEAARARASGFPLPAAICLAVISAAALTFARVQSVWGTGAFFDSDDAMRAVEVRDLIAGQHWFDMSAHRVDPPAGLFMHWSRVVDAPLAGLNLFFRLFLAPETAERVTRLVFPFGLFAALLGLAAWVASILSVKAARLPAVWLTFLSGAVFVQFAPGRIDHHAPQIVLLMAALGFFLQGLDAAKARSMALSAAAMALSVAISLENLPFFIPVLAALPALLVLDGDKARARLAWFSAGALLVFPPLYAATVGPDRYFISACDAYSAVHLAAAATGALSLALLAAFAPRLTTPRMRVYAAAMAAGAVLSSVPLIAPRCLGDPLGGLDPLLRDLWLSRVAEVRSLFSFYEKSPNVVVVNALPVALGLAAALFAGATHSGVARLRWLVLAAAIAAGLAAGLWHVRVFTSVTPLAMVSLAVAATALTNRYAAAFSPLLQGSLTGVLCLAVSPLGLALALPAPEGAEQGADLACLAPAALAPLAQLPPARVAAPVDMGAHLLAHTPHGVFAAPYHRDNHGARIAIDAFLAPPAEAERILRAAGAELVIWCVSEKKPNVLLERAPEGLAAALVKGKVPAWLERKAVEGTPLLVFAVR
jgi:hypothetical protein